MINQAQSPGVWYDGIALVRLTVGVMLILNGWPLVEGPGLRVFPDLLLNMTVPVPEAMAYTGKVIQLVGGFFLILGLFTRVVTVLLFVMFMIITFGQGESELLLADQLPFLYSLIFLLFFFTGAGRFSIDYILFVNRRYVKKERSEAHSKAFGRYVSKN